MDDYTDDSAANNKLRKAELERRGEICCGHCRYHRGDNAKRQDRRSWKRRSRARKAWGR